MNPENVNIWTNVISTVGFPIFCAVALGFMFYRTLKAHREEMRQMRSEQTAEIKNMRDEQSQQLADIRNEHKEEIKELTKAVDQLTDFVKEFVTLVREGEKK